MTYDDVVRLFNSDDKYVTYLAKRFLVPLSLDDIAVSEGLPAGAFHRLFVDFPEYEQKFNSKVIEEDENAKDMFLRQASSNALRKLADIIADPEETDNKDIIQACRAILTYRPTGKKPDVEHPLDSIFKDLVKEGDGQ